VSGRGLLPSQLTARPPFWPRPRPGPNALLLHAGFLMFLLVSSAPGFGVQYLACLVPWVVALGVKPMATYYVAGTAFLLARATLRSRSAYAPRRTRTRQRSEPGQKASASSAKGRMPSAMLVDITPSNGGMSSKQGGRDEGEAPEGPTRQHRTDDRSSDRRGPDGPAVLDSA
jgi:hypothetical protein